MNNILEFTDKQFITFLNEKKQYDAVRELASLFTDATCLDKEKVVEAMVEREEIMSTGVGFGLALPHVRNEDVKALTFAIGISRQGIAYDSMDKKPVHIMVAVLAKKDQHFDYLKLVSRIVAVLNNADIKQALIHADTKDEIWEILETKFK